MFYFAALLRQCRLDIATITCVCVQLSMQQVVLLLHKISTKINCLMMQTLTTSPFNINTNTNTNNISNKWSCVCIRAQTMLFAQPSQTQTGKAFSNKHLKKIIARNRASGYFISSHRSKLSEPKLAH